MGNSSAMNAPAGRPSRALPVYAHPSVRCRARNRRRIEMRTCRAPTPSAIDIAVTCTKSSAACASYFGSSLAANSWKKPCVSLPARMKRPSRTPRSETPCGPSTTYRSATREAASAGSTDAGLVSPVDPNGRSRRALADGLRIALKRLAAFMPVSHRPARAEPTLVLSSRSGVNASVPTPRRRNRVNPPKQDRSRATLDAIVVAATRVFAAKGYEDATMNEVAIAAGVSPGSLYQYAPTKGALAAHVMDTRSAEIIAYLGPRLLELASLPLAEAVGAAVRLTIEGHRMHAGLPNLPIADAPQEGPLSRLHEFERHGGIALRVYLEAHRSEVRPRNLDLAARITMHAIDAAVHAAMAVDPQLSNDELADELT